MYSFQPPAPQKKKIIIKPYDFTEQICLDFTEQAQKKGPTSILNKYPKAQPKRILKKKIKKKKQKQKQKPNMNTRPPQSSNDKAKANLKSETLKKKTSSRTTPSPETLSSST